MGIITLARAGKTAGGHMSIRTTRYGFALAGGHRSITSYVFVLAGAGKVAGGQGS